MRERACLGVDLVEGEGQAMTHVGLLLCARVLVGCATTPHIDVQTVKVPVPVECREPTPDRPSMPTEALSEDSDSFELLRASLAEIDRREGYEVKLVAALENCRRPLTVSTPPALPPSQGR